MIIVSYLATESSPDRAPSPDYVRTPATVVGPKSPTSPHKQVRGAYVNVQAGDEGKTIANADNVARTLETSRNRSSDDDDNDDNDGDDDDDGDGDDDVDAKPFAMKNSLPFQKSNVGSVVLAPSFDPTRTNYFDDNHPVELNNLELINTKNLEKPSSFCPKILKPSGNTPKLNRKLLISDFDTPNFCRKIVAQNELEHTIESERIVNGEQQTFSTFFHTTNDNDSINKDFLVEYTDNSKSNSNNSAKRITRDDRVDRKVKRSESYRMANSPIMFIKKFSSGNEKSSKIFRTPSEELREELLKERINYPETVSSPEPPIESNINYEANMKISMPIGVTIPSSPRPRALDLQPVKVLEYSGNDTEIW